MSQSPLARSLARNRRIVAVHGIRNKGQAIPVRDVHTARERMQDWQTRVKP